MANERNIKINLLQIFIIGLALADLVYGLFFLINPESFSAKFNLIINQPEDRLWRHFLGIYLLMSFALFFPALFAPMLYRHMIWIANVFRPLMMALILSLSSVGASGNETSASWISQQPFFLYLFGIYLALGLMHLVFLLLTRKEAMEAKQTGVQ
jgi:hypothetical protein